MISIRTACAVVLAGVMAVGLSAGAAASDELNRAKELYRSAAYDEALNLLNAMTAPADAADAVEVHEYRVFCLVALDRRDEAERAITALVTTSPLFVMSELEASPRVRSMFTEVRRGLLPSLVQRAYADAKAAFDRKDPGAVTQFDYVLTLLDDPDVKASPGLGDLATVAAGFRDLSKALAATPPPPAVAPPSAAAPPPVASVVVVPPVTLSQTVPSPQLREQREWDGEVEIVIDGRGKVVSARMTAPIHPVYDQQLTRAAMSWTYRPALRNGSPEQFVKRIPIHVDTRPECSPTSTAACRPATPPR